MKNIVTITLNPAFDIHLTLDEFIPQGENYINSSVSNIGGKGINITRALLKNDTCSTAIVVLGEENSQKFEKELVKENITYKAVYTKGKIRENITLHPKNQKETRLSFDSFYAQNSILSEIKELIPDNTAALAFSGRLPKGIDKPQVIKFLKEIKEKNIFLTVDCNSFTLEELIEISPNFIKPNETEIKLLTSKSIEEAALMLHHNGIEHILITRGDKAAVYAGKHGIKMISVPSITTVSTIGAGDSTIAGFLCEYIKKSTIDICLKMAAAFGTASCIKNGTTPPCKKDIEKIIEEIKITTIKDTAF